MQSSYPLGEAGLGAEKAAMELYYEFRRKLSLPTPAPRTSYIKGSVAHWWHRYRQMTSYEQKKPKTREEWEYCYRHFIGPELGDLRISKVTPAQFEAFFLKMERDHGHHARWRTVKIARGLFNAAKNYHIIDKSPCLTLQNTPPPPRKAFFFAHEIRKLIRVAEESNYPAMAVAIRVAWDTLLSPVDVRTITRNHLRSDGQGGYIETSRTKTSVDAFPHLTESTWRALMDYIDGLPFELMPDEPVLRTTRDGKAYTSNRFSVEFSIIRKLAFGDNEDRKFMDIRRSGNMEADIGGATKEERAAVMANSLDKDSRLDQTYTPATVTKSRQLMEKREVGRRLLHEESLNLKSTSVKTKQERG